MNAGKRKTRGRVAGMRRPHLRRHLSVYQSKEGDTYQEQGPERMTRGTLKYHSGVLSGAPRGIYEWPDEAFIG